VNWHYRKSHISGVIRKTHTNWSLKLHNTDTTFHSMRTALTYISVSL